MSYFDPIEIGGFTFEVQETMQGQERSIFTITEKNNPTWQFVVTSANAVQAFLRGVMIGAEGKM